MEWFENEDVTAIADTIKTFTAREISGKVVDLERLEKPEFPRAAIDLFSHLGYLWGPAPEDIGSNMNAIEAVVVLSKLAEVCVGFAAIVASHYAALNSILAAPDGFDLLKRVCDGNGARGGKTPLMGITLKDDIVLNHGSSEKTSYTAIPVSDKTERIIFFGASNGEAKMVMANSEEVLPHHVSMNDLSGCDEMPTEKLCLPDNIFQDLMVVGAGRDAMKARSAMLSSLKLYYSAIMQGAARSATAYALSYAKERRQTGRVIIEHQNVRKKLIEMEIKNQSMVSFLYRAAYGESDNGTFNLVDMLYAFTKAESEYVVNEAIQTLGGYGYIKEYGLEKVLRDIKTLQALLPTCLTDWLGLRGE